MKKTLGIWLLSGAALGMGCKKEVVPPAPVAPAAVEVAVVAEPSVEVEQDLIENFKRVYFDYDSANLSRDAKRALSHNADLLNRYESIQIRIQGHADERGTTEYNLHLGQRRAQRALDFLVNKGVSPERLELISYGEELPLENNSQELAFSKNRRAEFELVRSEGNLRGSVN